MNYVLLEEKGAEKRREEKRRERKGKRERREAYRIVIREGVV